MPAKIKHKQINNIERAAWRNMIDRCTNLKNKKYRDYGGRGITVCKKWLNSFDAFLEDMGRKTDPEFTLERVDNDKGYYKENCKWASQLEQQNNKRPQSCGTSKQFWFRAWHKDSMCQYISNNQSEFARKWWLLNTGNISVCLNGKQTSCKGWTFQRI